MSKAKKDKLMQEDYVQQGLRRLDPHLVTGKPPKIKWGQAYKDWTNKEKVPYLEVLACSMNHAADLIQKERNELNEVCAMKDKQVTKMSEAMKQNMDMLQSEVTRMNEQRQGYHAEVARLNSKIRELEKTVKELEKS